MSFGRRDREAPPLRLVVSSDLEPGDSKPKSPTAVLPAVTAYAHQPGLKELEAKSKLIPIVRERLPTSDVRLLTRGELADKILGIARECTTPDELARDSLEEWHLVTTLINESLAAVSAAAALEMVVQPHDVGPIQTPQRSRVDIAKDKVQPKLLGQIDLSAAATLPRQELMDQFTALAAEIVRGEKLQLNASEQAELVDSMLHDMLGLGPLEPLLADEKVTDILVNGSNQVYAERGGKLELTGVRFRDDAHLMNIATRIVARIGRRIDESNPLCDARLPDGSRVNIIIPPLAIDGPSISIRKFSKRRITLDIMAQQGNLSPPMATLLKIAGRCQLNILISGGTGSGKTTLLNAISQMIDKGERIVTIEDAAELQLQQPHVVRLETRPANLEGTGEVGMRDLVKNALRMRPDRIILGEVRGSEAIDMLQAMNTGHEGSLGTIHANRPREALTRLENMIGMAGINLPSKAARTQIAAALDMIVQVSRMRDGVRRITNITEVIGMEGDVITTQELFTFEVDGETPDGKLTGRFEASGLRPNCVRKAAYFGLEKALCDLVQ
jgi:pilus assembly protein CpaF